MKTRTLICAVAAASLSLGSLSSFAQGYDRGHGDKQVAQRDDNRRGNDRRDDNRRGDDRRSDDRRGDDRRYDARGDRGQQFHYGARGPEWRRGGHVPPEYRHRQYVVSDWRAHRLNAPQRGQQWVQVGGDYVLMAAATGVIVQLMLNQ
jgi:Ni/Co efflux regulator RcnB